MRTRRIIGIAALLLVWLAGCAVAPGVSHYSPYARDENTLQHSGGEGGGGSGM
jgi:hypothetical protein